MTKSRKKSSFEDHQTTKVTMKKLLYSECIVLMIALQCKFKVQDFKSYPLQFPFKDSSSLTRNTPTMMKEMSKMHEEDAHDDKLIAMETSDQIHTCAQMCAAENAAN